MEQLEFSFSKRFCMYCHVPITACFGYVLPRDILLALENKLPAGKYPRELCSKFLCNEKWKKSLYEETGDKEFLQPIY